MPKAFLAVILYIIFLLVTILIMSMALPNAPALVQGGVVLIVPFWLVSRSLASMGDKPAASAPHLGQDPSATVRKEPETLEEFEMARESAAALRWINKT